MTIEEENKWRHLCQQAVCEKDVGKLLSLFLEINRLEERRAENTGNDVLPRFTSSKNTPH